MKKLFKLFIGVLAANFCFLGGNGVKAEENINIFLAGDSTVCDWDAIRGEGYYEPQAGWGQMLYRYFDDTVTIKNGAISGYSSKTFYQGCVAKNDNVRHLDELIKNAKEGDYLLVQFGHNDSSKPTEEQKTTRPDVVERYVTTDEYKEYLGKYVDDARAKGVIPVLVTPCARFSVSKGQFVSSFGAYVEAMKELAEEKEVLLVDLDKKSREYYTELGEEGVKGVFLFCDAGIYPDSYYKNGVQDKTHYQKFGAIQLARMVAEGLKELDIKALTNHMNDNVTRPETVPETPSNLKVISDKGTMFSFSWDEVSGADLYTVYRVTHMPNGKEYISIVKQTEENKCVFTDLEKNKEYTYYVVSKNMSGESDASEKVVRSGVKEKNDTKDSFLKETKAGDNKNPIIFIIIGAVVVIGIATFFIIRHKVKRGRRSE